MPSFARRVDRLRGEPNATFRGDAAMPGMRRHQRILRRAGSEAGLGLKAAINLRSTSTAKFFYRLPRAIDRQYKSPIGREQASSIDMPGGERMRSARAAASRQDAPASPFRSRDDVARRSQPLGRRLRRSCRSPTWLAAGQGVSFQAAHDFTLSRHLRRRMDKGRSRRRRCVNRVPRSAPASRTSIRSASSDSIDYEARRQTKSRGRRHAAEISAVRQRKRTRDRSKGRGAISLLTIGSVAARSIRLSSRSWRPADYPTERRALREEAPRRLRAGEYFPPSARPPTISRRRREGPRREGRGFRH